MGEWNGIKLGNKREQWCYNNGYSFLNTYYMTGPVCFINIKPFNYELPKVGGIATQFTN